MKIGVILRPVFGSCSVSDRYTLNRELEEVISNYGGVTVGFTRYDSLLLEELDGVILQGGEDYTSEDLKIVEYLYKHDIPTLGICLGMQTMSVFKGGLLYQVKNHYMLERQTVHRVFIDKESYFYRLIQEDSFYVNSRHHDAVYLTSLDIVGKSEDNVIEVVEDKKKRFFIGVQWHPETDFKENRLSHKLFDAYFDAVRNKMLALGIDKC